VERQQSVVRKYSCDTCIRNMCFGGDRYFVGSPRWRSVTAAPLTSHSFPGLTGSCRLSDSD
jgi:hypothetical protein